MKKPRSWKEARALPWIDEITTDPKDSRGEGDMRIFVYLNEGEDNPVTGETGGGFYVGGLKDLISHYF